MNRAEYECEEWKELGSGWWWNIGLLSTTNSWLVENAAVVSGLFAVTYWLAVSAGDIRSSGPRTSLTDSRHGNLNFRRVTYFRFLTGFYFRSHFYIRDSGETTASPCAWPEDHGRVGSTRPTSLERVTMGVGSVSRAARIEADSHCRLLRPTLLDDVVSMVFTKIRYLLDSESTRLTTKAATLPQVKCYANSTSKTWENSLEWELLFPLHKIYVRKISFATTNASSNASTSIATN